MSCNKTITYCMILAAVLYAGCNAEFAHFRINRSSSAPLRENTASVSNAGDIEEFRRAEELIEELKYVSAETILSGLKDRFRKAGDVRHASKSLFWLGFCAEKLHRPKQAIERYDLVMDLYPGTPAADQSSRRKRDLIESESE